MLSGTCAGCHGSDGSSVAITPSIAGLSDEYFIDTMQAFKSDERQSTVMGRIAKGYSDDEIAAMAGYFAKLSMKPMQQPFDQAKAAQGAKLHEESCEKCHEEGGTVAEDGAPLAGQSMLYLQYSMEDFQAGARDMPKKMKKKLKQLVEAHGQAGLDAVIHYYGSQQ
jgi:sulfide dehydrogenase cytochrome subunit